MGIIIIKAVTNIFLHITAYRVNMAGDTHNRENKLSQSFTSQFGYSSPDGATQVVHVSMDATYQLDLESTLDTALPLRFQSFLQLYNSDLQRS